MLTFASLALPFQVRHAQALNLLDDHRLRGRALRTIGKSQAAGNLRQVLQPHGDMKPAR